MARQKRAGWELGIYALAAGVAFAWGSACGRSGEPRTTVPTSVGTESPTVPVAAPSDVATAPTGLTETDEVATTAVPTASAVPSTSGATSATAVAGRGVVLTLGPASGSFGSSFDAALDGVIHNRGPAPVALDMCVLASPILALEFRDAAGQRILTIPPGMPPTAAERARCEVTLRPGEKKTVTYGLHVFSPELPKGTYSARARAIESNTVSFRITGR